MIHDVLLCCLNLSSNKSSFDELLLSQAVQEFMHPCEKKILEDISAIINLIREVIKFTRTYGSHNLIDEKTSAANPDAGRLREGNYLKAFANGIDIVLKDYFNEIAKLERRHLVNPLPSLILIFQKVKMYEPLAHFLRKLVRGIQMQKLHGCSILQYIHQHRTNGDIQICKAMRTLQSTVNVVFIKQLTLWIMYSKIEDQHGEFFIQCSDLRNKNKDQIDRVTSNLSEMLSTTTVHSDATSTTYDDIWRYEILDNFLPLYLSAIWAEKVLFIGQTVLLFNVETKKINKNAHVWNDQQKPVLRLEDSLWGGRVDEYFGKIQALQHEREINVSHFEHVVDDIKNYVTSRLSEIAVNQADLVHHLRLVKDFYLLGRGELFLEFIRQAYIIEKDEKNKNKLRDFVMIYQTAVGVSDHLNQFTLSIIEGNELNEFGYLQHVQLQYKINWPLHLLFSPTVIKRYNVLFRYLLLVKKMQCDLHMVWWNQTREAKISGEYNIKEMHLRNQLMFFVDNLQYYIQVDVLESQFSVLLNSIDMDFEKIQRLHSVFLANILSLCFLLTDDDSTKGVVESANLHSNNPVHVILNDIFHLCADFCKLLDSKKSEDKTKAIEKLDESFGKLIKQLISLLVDLKTSPNTSPLSQLLLRLDFNQWFSSERKTSIH